MNLVNKTTQGTKFALKSNVICTIPFSSFCHCWNSDYATFDPFNSLEKAKEANQTTRYHTLLIRAVVVIEDAIKASSCLLCKFVNSCKVTNCRVMLSSTFRFPVQIGQKDFCYVIGTQIFISKHLMISDSDVRMNC